MHYSPPFKFFIKFKKFLKSLLQGNRFVSKIQVMKHYDVLVVGSGGGTKLVRPVAKLGKNVALVEKGPLGGTCLNRGCIPSKMLIQSAHLASLMRDSERFEIYLKGGFTVDFPHLVNRVSTTVDNESKSIAPLYEQETNIDYYPHAASFVDEMTLQVGDETISADKIFLAVGARATVPNIPGLEETPFMTYSQALRNMTQPEKLIVIGGGYIATELGYFYAALGTQTEFLVRSKFLRPEDDDVREAFQEAFAKQVTLRIKCDFKEVKYVNGVFSVRPFNREVRQIDKN